MAGQNLSGRRRGREVHAGSSGADRRHARRPRAGLHGRPDAARRAHSAGGVRQPGKPVCGAGGGSRQGNGAAPGAGFAPRSILRQMLTEAVLVSLAGGALGLAGGVVILRLLSAWQPIPDIPINVPVNPDAGTYVVALAACAGERAALRHGAGAPGDAGRSLAGDSHRRGRCGRAAAVHVARHSARGADCDLRGAGHVFAGGGARAGAIACTAISALCRRT